jgi:predicted PurR-regulated permease PerM
MEGLIRKIYDAKWVILGAILIFLLARIAWPFLDVIVYAIFLYYITRPIKRRLRPYIKNETLLVLACLILLVLPLVLIMGYTFLIAVNQINNLIQNISYQSLPSGPLTNVSSVISGLQAGVSPGSTASKDLPALIGTWYQEWLRLIRSTAGIPGIIIATGMTLIDVIFRTFIILTMAFYMLRDDDRLKAWFASAFPGLVAEHDGLLTHYFRAVDRDLEDIFFGNILSVAIFAAIAIIVYNILNFFAPVPSFLIPLPILMGILLGVAQLLPVVGPWTVDIPILLYIAVRSIMAGTFFDNIGYFIVMIIVIFIFVENLPGYVLRPFISHGRVSIGLLMFAYILGPLVFGISGLFIAVIVLVLLTYYFKIIVPQLTRDSQDGKQA